MVHLPVLHGSGVVRQSHAALKGDRKKKNNRVRILDAPLEPFALAPPLPHRCFSTRNVCRGESKRGTPSIALLHKEVSGIQRRVINNNQQPAKSQTSHFEKGRTCLPV